MHPQPRQLARPPGRGPDPSRRRAGSHAGSSTTIVRSRTPSGSARLARRPDRPPQARPSTRPIPTRVLSRPSAELTVGAFLDGWLTDVVRLSVRPRTYASYRYIVALHLTPTLGDIPLASLSPADVQALPQREGGLGSVAADGRVPPGRPARSPRSRGAARPRHAQRRPARAAAARSRAAGCRRSRWRRPARSSPRSPATDSRRSISSPSGSASGRARSSACGGRDVDLASRHPDGPPCPRPDRRRARPRRAQVRDEPAGRAAAGVRAPTRSPPIGTARSRSRCRSGRRPRTSSPTSSS